MTTAQIFRIRVESLTSRVSLSGFSICVFSILGTIELGGIVFLTIGITCVLHTNQEPVSMNLKYTSVLECSIDS